MDLPPLFPCQPKGSFSGAVYIRRNHLPIRVLMRIPKKVEMVETIKERLSGDSTFCDRTGLTGGRGLILLQCHAFDVRMLTLH